MSLIRKMQIFSSNVSKLWTIDEANTARTTSTIVGSVQQVDSTGKVPPSGEVITNAPYTKNTNYNSSDTEIFTPTNRGYVDSLSTKSSGLSTATTIINVTTTSTIIVPANINRLTVQIQNHGTVPILIKIDGTPTITDYNFILAASSGVRIGDGAVFDTQTTLLSISGIAETGNADVSILEEEF